MSAAIRIEGLAKTYFSGFLRRPIRGLNHLDLEVPRGQVFGFVGPNGAGKTTTIKILVGLQTETKGKAFLFDKAHSDPAARRSLGFLPERPYFYEHLTARELLHFYGSLYDLPKKVRVERIGMLLERVDMHRFADVPLRKFSKGMLQRVGLCQALLHDPELIILDEPMSGLDPLGRALVRDLILEERAAGRTVFFSSHILHDVETLADQIAILVEGDLRGVGTAEALLGARVRHVDAWLVLGAPLPEDVQVVRRDGPAVQVRVGQDRVDALVAQVLADGGRVTELTPARMSLEELLVDEIQAAKKIDPKRLGVLA